MKEGLKEGLTFGLVSWIVSLAAMPFLAPLLFPGGDMELLGTLWFGLSLALIGAPAFFYGYFKYRKRD